jgi:integrase
MPKKKNKRGQGSVFKRGRIWWIKYSVHGTVFPESTKSTDKRDADALLKQRLGEIATGVHAGVSSIRVGALLDLFIEEYIEKGRRDLYIAKKRINAHLRPILGAIRAADFGSHDIKHYIKLRRDGKCCLKCRKHGEGAENATINRELSIIRHAFTIAAKMDPPRVLRIPHVLKLEEDNARTGIVTPEQYEALKHAMAPHAALALSIGYHTGMRRGAILELRWEWVDLAAGVIRIPPKDTRTKKKPRVVPIYGDMRPLLEMARSAAETPYVIEWRGDKVLDIKKTWGTACKACGLQGVLFHDLRRTAATNALMAGVPEVNIMEMCGWKNVAMLRRYAQGLVNRAQDTARKMEAFMEQQRPTQIPRGKAN